MNKKEKSLLTELYWYIERNKNEHPALYYSKDVLQSILKGEYSVADTLLKIKGTSLKKIEPMTTKTENSGKCSHENLAVSVWNPEKVTDSVTNDTENDILPRKVKTDG